MTAVAFATCSAYPTGIADDQRAAQLVGAEFQVWDDPSVDWHAYDRVVVRSVWDYTTKLDAPTVPTTLLEPGDRLPRFDSEVVIRQNISAGARDTGRFMPDAAGEAARLVERIRRSGRAVLMQPYLRVDMVPAPTAGRC